MEEAIYDLYVSRINRFTSDHQEIQKELAKFINELINSKNLKTKFGQVLHVHIPYISSESSYKELKTCIGFVRLSRYENHGEAAEFLWGKSFKGTQLNVLKRQKPTGEVSLKNAYVNKDAEYNSEEASIAASTSSVAASTSAAAASISAAASTTAIFDSAAASVEIEQLKKQIKEERELRRLAEFNAESLASKMTRMVLFHEVSEERIRSLTRENNEKSNKYELLEARGRQLDNNVGIMIEEMKLLKEENEKLRNQASEHLELANQVAKLVKKF